MTQGRHLGMRPSAAPGRPFIFEIYRGTVRVQINPVADRFLFGAPAGELADRHTRLDDVWESTVDNLCRQMTAAKSLARSKRFRCSNICLSALSYLDSLGKIVIY